jgi:hypothetical protein
MGSKYRWSLIFVYFCVGGFVIFVPGMALVLLLAVGILPNVGASNAAQGYVDLISVSIITIASFLLAVGLAQAEMLNQRDKYRQAAGLCVHCGYNLHGIRLASKKCPECGEAFQKR